MIRIATILLTASLGLVACGASSSEPAASSKSKSAKTEMTPLERGAKLYKRCRTCHTLDEGGRHRVGPNLWGVFGATAGTKEGFNYSAAMAESGIVWNEETISLYLEKPQSFIKGNRMSFAGFRKAEDRDAVIAYLKSKTGADDMLAEDVAP